jgi:eukaryotic-like serine/threonine-protein kinase
MTPERWQQVKGLLHEAKKLAPERRSAFLQRSCSDDQSLRQELESLLASAEKAPPGFLQSSTVRVTLTKGTRLGEYEVESLVGYGGMGEVYRARDRRLDRDVAIKVLPRFLSSDPDRLRRFEQEARAAAALNHPNILAVYQMGTHEGAPYLVSELLKGETLREHVRRGPLELPRLLDYSVQIADGLAAAHGKGIVHCDLKPANLFVTHEGRIKILDFGLAKLTEPKPECTATTLGQQTEPGMVMGTLGYMSPEQLHGRPADARSDIFSLGTVLYEAATGKAAFAGESQASIIAAVLEKAPTPPRDLRKDVPPSLQAVVRRCLEKDPNCRWQCTADMASELRRIANAPERRAPAVSAKGNGRERIVWIACCGILLVASVVMGLRLPSARIAPPVVRSVVLPPEGARFAFVGDVGGPLVLSPDGRFLAFVAASAAGQNHLYVRPLESTAARAISGSEGAVFPFWSPDSQSLGFFAAGKLRRVDIAGGAPVTLCDVGNARGGTWSSSGVIVFASSARGALSKVSDQGGNPTLLTKLEEPQHTTHRWPYFLPDGNHFLYLAANHNQQSEGAAIYYSALDGSVNKLLLHTKGNAVFANEHVLFVNGTELLARRFDVKQGAFAGEAVSLAADVLYDPGVWRGMFTASQAALLAYQPSGTASDRSELEWVDRSGKLVQQVGEKHSQTAVRVSSSGHWAMIIESSAIEGKVLQARTGADLWLLNTTNGEHRRLTFSGDVSSPVCSPDESWVAYTRESQGIYRRMVSGAGNEEVLLHAKDPVIASTWSPDTKYLVFERYTGAANTARDLWLLPIEGDRKPRPLLQTNGDQSEARVSPDGRWIAYTSDESGRTEVYLSPFPSMGAKRQISLAGGNFARWRGDSREIFYLSPDYTIQAAQVQLAGDHFDVTGVTPLFRADLRSILQSAAYDVAPDGQRFLLNSPGEEQAKPVMLVQNWPAELAPKQF